jgi:cupin fold WbuC family metalloprotein
MRITQAILDKLTEQAKVSERLRMNLDLRDTDVDGSQRMLNAIEPGSVLPIHRHQKTSETMVCLRGRLQVEFFAEQSGEAERYDELERICTDSFVIEPNGVNVAVSIPIGVWHTVQALESGTCVLEMKDGKYEPIQDCDVLG